MRSFRRLLNVHVLVVFLAVCSGCESSSTAPFVADLVPVTGTVKLDGAPAAGIEVTFVPDQRLKNDNVGGNATAVTDSEGKFSVITPPGGGASQDNLDAFRGAVPGKYAATFHLWVLPDGKPWALSENSKQGPALMGAVEKLPAHLGNPLASRYIVDVKNGGTNVFDFDLKSK